MSREPGKHIFIYCIRSGLPHTYLDLYSTYQFDYFQNISYITGISNYKYIYYIFVNYTINSKTIPPGYETIKNTNKVGHGFSQDQLGFRRLFTPPGRQGTKKNLVTLWLV